MITSFALLIVSFVLFLILYVLKVTSRERRQLREERADHELRKQMGGYMGRTFYSNRNYTMAQEAEYYAKRREEQDQSTDLLTTLLPTVFTPDVSPVYEASDPSPTPDFSEPAFDGGSSGGGGGGGDY